MNIKLVRLVTGHDVLAEVKTNISDDDVCLVNPVMLAASMEGNQITVNFAPFCLFSSSKEYTVSKVQIMFITDPAQDIANQYNNLFGSGIVVASPSETAKLGKPGLKLVP